MKLKIKVKLIQFSDIFYQKNRSHSCHKEIYIKFMAHTV